METLDSSAAVARRFDVANLRVQIRQAQHRLDELDIFQDRWDEFAGYLHMIIAACEKPPGSFWDPRFDDLLREAEAIRLDLATRHHIAIQDYRDPLAKFVRTSVRKDSEDLWSLIGDTVTGRRGEVLVHPDDGGNDAVSSRVFELNSQEARAQIVRRRRDLQEEIGTLRIMLEEAEHANKLWPIVWEKVKKSALGRFLWWFGEEPLRKVLGGLATIVILAALVYLIGHFRNP